MNNTTRATLMRLLKEITMLEGRLEFHTTMGVYMEEGLPSELHEKACEAIMALDHLADMTKEVLENG